MGVNATPVIGRIRLTQPVANTPAQIYKDVDRARELCIKLEDELLGDEEEGADGEADEEKKDKVAGRWVAGLRERGSDVVKERTQRVLEGLGLSGEGDELSEEGKVRKVSPCSALSRSRLMFWFQSHVTIPCA
jgi:hypothetical protein